MRNRSTPGCCRASLPAITGAPMRRSTSPRSPSELYVELEQGLVERLDLKQRMVLMKGGAAYDVASLNVGSQIARGFRGAASGGG